MDDEIPGIALGDWDGINLGRVRIQQPQAQTGRIKELLTQKSTTDYLWKSKHVDHLT